LLLVAAGSRDRHHCRGVNHDGPSQGRRDRGRPLDNQREGEKVAALPVWLRQKTAEIATRTQVRKRFRWEPVFAIDCGCDGHNLVFEQSVDSLDDQSVMFVKHLAITSNRW
jgi:hypothetical protein